MKSQSPITVSDLFDLIRKDDQLDSYCIYGKGDSSPATLSSICYVDNYPVITDDYDEIDPQFVTENKLGLWYREELVQDVIANVLHQDPHASNATILEAVKHYSEKDSFMNIS